MTRRASAPRPDRAARRARPGERAPARRAAPARRQVGQPSCADAGRPGRWREPHQRRRRRGGRALDGGHRRRARARPSTGSRARARRSATASSRVARTHSRRPRANSIAELRDEPPADERRPGRAAPDGHPRRRRFVAPPSGGSYHRTTALDGCRPPWPARRFPPTTDRDRSYPASGDRLHDDGAERTGEVGHPARGTSRGRADDGPRVGRDPRPHGTDAASEGRAGRADGRTGRVGRMVAGRRGRRCAQSERVPGDVSAAAFWLVAGAIHPDAELTLHDVGVNPTRRAIIDILRSMGADIEERRHGDGARRRRRRAAGGRHGALVGPACGRPRAVRCGRRHRRDPGALPGRDGGRRHDRHPRRGRAAPQGVRPDRGDAAGLRALGARIEVDGDDLRITGPTRSTAPRPTASTITVSR